MKKNFSSALFGDLTEEELKQIKQGTEELERISSEFQKRPNYEQAAHTEIIKKG